MVRCNFFDLNNYPNDPNYAVFIDWIRNNENKFIDAFLATPVVCDNIQIGHVLSISLEAKKFLVAVDKSIIRNATVDCTVIKKPGTYLFKISMSDKTFPMAFPNTLYDNQYEYLLNRELGEF